MKFTKRVTLLPFSLSPYFLILIQFKHHPNKILAKGWKVDSHLASICFEVQSGSRKDFVGLGRGRRTSSLVLKLVW